MRKENFKLFVLAFLLSVFSFTACKNKAKENTDATTTAVDSSTSSAPVIAGNDELRKGVIDATKDYPSVKADVTDSVINVSGEINRTDWQKLIVTLNSLHPKRVNSANLTIK